MLPNTLLFGQAVYQPGSGAFRGLEGAQAFQEGVYCLSSFPATTVLHDHGLLCPLLSTELRDELSHKQQGGCASTPQNMVLGLETTVRLPDKRCSRKIISIHC